MRPIERGRSWSSTNEPSSWRATTGAGRYGSRASVTATGPAPGPPPPCGVVNVLCRLKWTMSKPMSPGPRLAHDRVEVGAVVVQERAVAVEQVRDVDDLLLEQAERRRVRQHQAGGLVRDLLLQVLEVDVAARVRLHPHHLVARHRHAGRVRAVGRVRDDHGAPLAALRLVVGAHQQQAQQLALRARRRLQRRVRQARRSRRGSPAGGAAAPGCPGAGVLLQRVQRREPRQRRHLLVHLRVVLHGAGAERVEVRVDRGVELREAHVVAHQVELRDLRQPRRLRAPQALREERVEVGLRHVEGRQRVRAAPGDAALEDRLRLVQRAVEGRGGILVHGHPTTSESTKASRSMSRLVRFSVTATSRQSSSSG